MAILSAADLEAAQQTAATAQASTGFVDVDGGKLHYEKSNHGGQTVVLLHDGVVDSAVWDDAMVKGTASTPSGERFSRISAYAVENHNQEGAPSQARE